MQIVHGGQASGPARQQLERAQGFHFLDAAHRFGAVVVNLYDAALVALGIVQGLHLALHCLVEDLAVRLAQPVAVGVHALLTGLAVLPHQIPFRHPRETQAVRQYLRDKRLMGQAIGEARYHGGAFFGKAEHAGFLAAHGNRQRQAGE